MALSIWWVMSSTKTNETFPTHLLKVGDEAAADRCSIKSCFRKFLKMQGKYAGKHLCRSSFKWSFRPTAGNFIFKGEAPVLSFALYEFLWSNFFAVHLQLTTSEEWRQFVKFAEFIMKTWDWCKVFSIFLLSTMIQFHPFRASVL